MEERRAKRMKSTLLSRVLEKAAKLQTSYAPYFPNDLIFKIMLLLPIKTLLRFTCVCKTWYKLINSSDFVEAYNSQADSVLIFYKQVNHRSPSAFCVETQVKQPGGFLIFDNVLCSHSQPSTVHLMQLQDGCGVITELNISCFNAILATCNGLVLMRSKGKPGRVVVMNPMTRKFISFPMGTINVLKESYGLVFSHGKGVYKVVHLFQDDMRFFSCEILSLRTRSWKAVDGPDFGLIRQFAYAPVSAIGALHWLPDSSGASHVVSMGIDDESFAVRGLPKMTSLHDRLVAIGDLLSFVFASSANQIEVWILKGLYGTDWIRQYTIHVDAIPSALVPVHSMVPIFTLNGTVMVFRGQGKLYSYDFLLEEIRQVELGTETFHGSGLPHANNLATWEPLESLS
ncbi:hypothetical protein Ancab_036681 [Ancistrocladus abbreviatus]